MDNKLYFSQEDDALLHQSADKVEIFASFLLQFADDLRSEDLTPEKLDILVQVLQNQHNNLTEIEVNFRKMIDLHSSHSKESLAIQSKNNILMFPSPFNDNPA
jgi:hypothetical protein